MSWCSSASSVRSSAVDDEVERAERLLLELAQLVLEVERGGPRAAISRTCPVT